jgi:hypothetical protein
MSEDRPFIESAHVKLSGISSEAFDLPTKGEERVYTVLARRDGYAVREFKTQPDRVEATMKIIRLVEGSVDLKPNEEDGQMSIADVPEDDEESGVLGDTGEFVGPQFSAGE